MSTVAIVLAAGLSTRMKSKKPKVLHELCGRPFLFYPLNALKEAKIPYVIIVVSSLNRKEIEISIFQAKALRMAKTNQKITFVEQKKPMGTADAVKTALKKIPKNTKKILILCGDAPLISSQTIKALISFHNKNQAEISFVSANMYVKSELGRIVRSGSGRVEKIVEFKDANSKQKAVREVNSGFYCVDSHVLKKLSSIKNSNKKKEFYLTDLVALSSKAFALKIDDCDEIMGINTRVDLEKVRVTLQRKIHLQHMMSGVTLIHPRSIMIDQQVKIGQDVTIYPGVYLKGRTTIGDFSIIEQNCIISNSTIAQGAHIKHTSNIEESILEEEVQVGPFARLRPGTHLKQKARIGNFVELKKTTLGKNSKANHLTYLGDAEIGNDVNIGCGVITCNFDGFQKHKTVVEERAFVGSDCQLVAPVRVGKGAYVGSGSTITKNVPKGALAIARSKQVNIEGYAKKLKKKKDGSSPSRH